MDSSWTILVEITAGAEMLDDAQGDGIWMTRSGEEDQHQAGQGLAAGGPVDTD